jgi:heptaprenyl diphosphate synthase
MSLLKIYIKLKKDLGFLEEQLEATIRSDHLLMDQTSSHQLKAGGKRIRPVFVLLSAQFGDYNLEQIKKVAVPLELVHMATLVHDDVIDNAQIRRGQPTVKAKWDNRVAMYTGDYIFSKSLQMVSTLQSPKAHQILSKAIMEMCMGELDQLHDFYRWDQTLKDYLRRIKRKTALLIAISCELGALAANVSPEHISHLYRYGYYVGMAFQIVDDILDIIGTEKQLGKPAGSDLRQGNITLPVLYALHCSPQKNIISSLIPALKTEEGVAQMIDAVKTSGGIEFAESVAQKYIAKGIRSLDKLPDQPAKQDLLEIARFVRERTY